ncbi:MAG: hypothetical protein ACTSO7_16675 [Candidatus Heimdallarchaeota archaeon]
MREIKLDMGYKPDLTIDRVMEIFKQNFEYDVVLLKENSFIIKQGDAFIAAKVTLKQKVDKTILKITDTENIPTDRKVLFYIGVFILGFFGNIIALILVFALHIPKIRKFMKPIEEFAKNHPEFK